VSLSSVSVLSHKSQHLQRALKQKKKRVTVHSTAQTFAAPNYAARNQIRCGLPASQQKAEKTIATRATNVIIEEANKS
jgi:hypothetical protein